MVEEYGGSDQIRVGNGTGLSIKHIGTVQISTPSLKFHLNNVFHVPQITKNIPYVHQFTKATKTYFEFHPYHFFVKDRATGKLLLRGQNNHRLYTIPFISSINKSPHWWVNELLCQASIPVWVIRLLVSSVVFSFPSSFQFCIIRKVLRHVLDALYPKVISFLFLDHYIVAKFL
jgi:hypothetical protein